MRRQKSAKPMRRCIACRESKPQNELMRFTCADGVLTADVTRRNDGRGFYLCRDEKCIDMAIRRRSFSRALRRNADEEEVRAVIGQALDNSQGGIDAKES